MGTRRWPGENWGADGHVDVSELLSKFDGDNSGTLDREELLPLLQQVLAQTEFTNGLLEQMRGLEETNLHQQREMRAKHKALGEAVHLAEDLRAENDEVKEKCRNSEFKAKQLQDEVVKWREAAEKLSKDVSQIRSDAEAGLAEKKDAIGQFEEALRSAASKAADQKRDSDKKHAVQVEALQKSQEAARQCAKEVREMKKRLEETEKKADSDAKKVADFRAETRRLTGMKNEAEKKAMQLGAQNDALVKETAKFRAALGSTANEVDSKDRALLESEEKNRAAQEDVKNLQAELERVQGELLRLAEARAFEKRQLELRLADVETQRRDAAAALRDRAKADAVRAAKQVAEDLEFRKEAEQAYVSLQKKYADVHQAFDRLRCEFDDYKKTQADESRDLDEKTALKDSELRHAQFRIDTAEKARDQAQRDLVQVSTAYESKLRQANALKADAFLYSANAVRLARDASLDVANRAQTLVEKVQATLDACSRVSTSKPQSDIDTETSNALAALVEGVRDFEKKSLSDRKKADDATKKCAQLDDSLKQAAGERTLLEARLGDLERQRDDASASLREQLAAADVRIRAAEQKTADADERVSRFRLQLDQTQNRADTAESELRAVQNDLADLRTELARKNGSSDDSLRKADEKIAALEAEIQDANDIRARLQTQTDDLEHALEQHRADKLELERDLASLRDNRAAANRNLPAELAALNENVARLNTQLDMTKKLLHVVQQQRAQLQEDNMLLNAKLDQQQQQQQQRSPVVSSSAGRAPRLSSSPSAVSPRASRTIDTPYSSLRLSNLLNTSSRFLPSPADDDSLL